MPIELSGKKSSPYSVKDLYDSQLQDCPYAPKTAIPVLGTVIELSDTTKMKKCQMAKIHD